MANSLDIKINLGKLRHTVITTQKNTKCIVIPIVENDIYEGKDGNSFYFSMTGWEIDVEKQKVENNFKNTHLVKQKFRKDKLASMSDDEKKALPILGNVTCYVGGGQNETPVHTTSVSADDFSKNNDDLPF